MTAESEQFCPICRRPVTQIIADYRGNSPLQPRTYWPCGHAPVRQLVAKSRGDHADACMHTMHCDRDHKGSEPCSSPNPPMTLAQHVQDYREAFRSPQLPQPWYIHLPLWVVQKGGLTFEEFAAKFDESAKRTHIPLLGAIGFEVEYYPGQIRRHRISWLNDDTQSPRQEDHNDDQPKHMARDL